VPVNSGSRPGAPLGGHSTKFAPLPEDPVAVAAPAVDPVDPVDPPPPRLPPPPPPPDAAAPPAVVEVVVEPGEVVEVVELVAEEVAVVPAIGVEAVAGEFWTLGNATAPPPAGNPLRCAALPTAPLVGVAEGAVLWAAAAAASAIDSSKANPAVRIMAT
jgi:hypothetical protein